ncbi:hypothetical protein NHX12_034330 [Muraenolepis orangiensis]|uniref:RRM domain-containing protein n=1 Tax=Muraenolepis orangiensis TaxID=630683 RepID=A0A9Q0HZU3_9TELE|nr:hypothetical protein NHX12_034330 [Muraenolepis orangiensis]
MYAKCRSLFLLRRCATAGHVPLLTESLSRVTTREDASTFLDVSKRWTHVQHHRHHRWSSPVTPSLQVLATRQSAFKVTQLVQLCTKAGESDDEYPPLPAYSETAKNEVYIVHAKGLPWACTADDVLHFFSECRIRDGVKGIHLTLNRQGKPSGQAIIEMEHEQDVGKALEKHRQYLVYEVSDSEAETLLRAAASMPSTASAAVTSGTGTSSAVDSIRTAAGDDGTVRIRGLPYSSTVADILRFFSGLDVVEDGVTIVRDLKGRNSGEAYVCFASQETADEALERDRGLIGNRYIEVFPSTKSQIRSSWKRSDALPPAHVSRSPSSPPWGEPIAASSQATDFNFVHMRGIPFDVNGLDIAGFFHPLALSKILIEFGQDGKPRGEADVFFRSHQDAVSAMSRDRMYLGGRYIELFLNSANNTAGDC